MFVLAVTGGLGAGKSHAAEFFRGKGSVVLDLDGIAHQQLEPGRRSYSRVIEEFGEGILDDIGRINHAKLAARAFASPEDAERLNAIIHPAVVAEVAPGLTDLRLLPFPPEVVVIDVPLIIEAPVFRELADVVLAVEASEDVRVARAVERGMRESDARTRIALQSTDAERASVADSVIINEGTVEAFDDELERFWNEVVVPRVA